MRLLRGLAGSLTWLLAIVLGLVGVILCVTIILIPLGIVVLRLAKSLLGTSRRLAAHDGQGDVCLLDVPHDRAVEAPRVPTAQWVGTRS